MARQESAAIRSRSHGGRISGLHSFRRILFPALGFLLACGKPETGYSEWSGKKRTDYVLPVRVSRPTRGEVEDFVETQANLESDRKVSILAESDGQIRAKLKEVGDRVGQGESADALILARLDDRDQALALKDAEINLRQSRGRILELDLENQRSQRLLEQALVQEREAEAAHKRTSSGIKDGTISREEHETATFALRRAKAGVAVARAVREKAEVALDLGSIAVETAGVDRDRAQLALDRTIVRAPFAGVVTRADVREGQWVRVGMPLFDVEDISKLVVYAAVPVRQATRIRAGNRVRVQSTATQADTKGEVLLVEPTVDAASGTVRARIRVDAAAGFRPGLFVNLRIVVERRQNALVLPKRAVLHHDVEGTYVFLVREGKAARVLVKTGYEQGDSIEIVEGLQDDSLVVVEGQDTATDGARVEIKKP